MIEFGNRSDSDDHRMRNGVLLTMVSANRLLASRQQLSLISTTRTEVVVSRHKFPMWLQCSFCIACNGQRKYRKPKLSAVRRNSKPTGEITQRTASNCFFFRGDNSKLSVVHHEMLLYQLLTGDNNDRRVMAAPTPTSQRTMQWCAANVSCCRLS